MRKPLLIGPFLAFFLAALLFFSVSSFQARADGLMLSAPASCPAGGCAAGQRLNFLTEFSVSPQQEVTPNTQICVYTPNVGGAWADYTNGWISASGLVTGITYTEGETGSVCTNPDNVPSGYEYLTGAYATLPSAASNDQLEFAFHIAKTTDIAGDVTVKVFQANADGSFGAASSTYTKSIPVAPIAEATTAYVAQSSTDCDDFSPCFVNSGDDLPNGLGTGLRDAVLALDPNAEIVILNDYAVKSNTVLVDKSLTIRGHENALVTYIGAVCNNPMISFTAGGAIRDLTFNDGNCSNPSRNLIEVNSPVDVVIEHNTLNSGYYAVDVKDNTGYVTVAFNQIANNLDYAVNRETGTAAGAVDIYANNITNNRSGRRTIISGERAFPPPAAR
jgi:hypothetical protein